MEKFDREITSYSCAFVWNYERGLRDQLHLIRELENAGFRIESVRIEGVPSYIFDGSEEVGEYRKGGRRKLEIYVYDRNERLTEFAESYVPPSARDSSPAAAGSPSV